MKAMREAGFSLLELLCALAIFSFAVVGLLQGITSALHASKEAERYSQAVWLASERLALLRAEGWIVEGEDDGEFEEPFELYAWRQRIEATEFEGLYEVEISVVYGDAESPLFDVQTLVFDRPYSSYGGSGLESGSTGTGRTELRDRLREREARVRGSSGGSP